MNTFYLIGALAAAGLLGVVEEGVLRRFRDWPAGAPLGLGVFDSSRPPPEPRGASR